MNGSGVVDPNLASGLECSAARTVFIMRGR